MDNSQIESLYLRMYKLSGSLNYSITLSERFLLKSSPRELKGQDTVLIFPTQNKSS